MALEYVYLIILRKEKTSSWKDNLFGDKYLCSDAIQSDLAALIQRKEIIAWKNKNIYDT